MSQAHFSPALFQFLRDLEANNQRDWFQANKSRYEDHAKEPALQFISDFGPQLETISRHFAADPRPVGGSLFRIYRDTRFARDKSPYKTHLGIQFRHRQARDAHAPGFYLHLEPGQVMAAAGIWHPDSAAQKRIREAMVEEPDRWRQSVGDPRFAARFELGGDSLKRPPRGYDPEHPLIEDLKRKDFYGFTRLTQAQATADDFLLRFADACRDAAPLVRFLCRALDVPF